MPKLRDFLRSEPYRQDIQVSTTIPPEWHDVLVAIVQKKFPSDTPSGEQLRKEGTSKAALLRNGLRLYLQHIVDNEDVWAILDLGPIPEKPKGYVKVEVIELDPSDFWEVVGDE